MPFGWVCRPMLFGHSTRTSHAGGHWRFTSTHLSGIIYPSRLNEATNLAIYDRAIAKLQAKHTCRVRDVLLVSRRRSDDGLAPLWSSCSPTM